MTPKGTLKWPPNPQKWDRRPPKSNAKNKKKNGMQQSDGDIFFLMIFWWFLGPRGLPEASWRHLGSRYQKRPQKVKLVSPVLGAIWGHFGAKSISSAFFVWHFLCLFLASLLGGFHQHFWGFGGSFQNAFWAHFEHFSEDAAKLKKCNPFKRNACFGRCWASGFALFLLTFCLCFLCCFLDGLFARFWRIWAPKGDPCWGPFWQF